jgi:hypothetical protein
VEPEGHGDGDESLKQDTASMTRAIAINGILDLIVVLAIVATSSY